MERSIFIFALIFSSVIGFSQQSINDLQIPTSPALVLMDVSPSSIEKPTNPKALSLNLLNLVQGGAVEFTPYWFKDHAGYTFTSYANQKFPFLQTLAFSAATNRSASGTDLGVGFRTQLFRYFSPVRRKDLEAARLEVVTLLSNPVPDLNENAIKAAGNYIRELKTKPTINIEMAGAYTGSSVGSVYKNLAATKSGVWLHFRWSPKIIPLDLVGLGRYSWQVGNPIPNSKDSSFVDYGLNISFQKVKFDFAIEYINRREVRNKTNYDRFSFVANYRISDEIVIVAAFGKNFNEQSDIFSVLGVKFSLSKERVDIANQ